MSTSVCGRARACGRMFERDTVIQYAVFKEKKVK